MAHAELVQMWRKHLTATDLSSGGSLAVSALKSAHAWMEHQNECFFFVLYKIKEDSVIGMGD